MKLKSIKDQVWIDGWDQGRDQVSFEVRHQIGDQISFEVRDRLWKIIGNHVMIHILGTVWENVNET
jgi:hypothetical protein